MTMFTLTIPFEFTHEYDEETEVQIPIFSPGLRPDHDLSQHAPSARWDPKSGAVRTSLDLASATYVYLTNNHKPEVPSLVDDAATSPTAHTALWTAAKSAADSAAPDGFATATITFLGETAAKQDLLARDPFARVTWTGSLKVTWAPQEH